MELETTKQKSKENLQQAILVERERVTKMQWDMEELRRKSLEMELKMKSEQVIICLSFHVLSCVISLHLQFSMMEFLLNVSRIRHHVQCQQKIPLFRRT